MQDLSLFLAGKSQIDPSQGDLGTSENVLKVILLANERRSSEGGAGGGGVSTLNRQLALKLAQNIQVEVTLFVPQFSCSEEERRVAKSNNIVIREAVERPGYDCLEWLSFPP